MAARLKCTSPLLAGYRLGGMALRPLVPLLLAARSARGKEDAARTAERYGRASLPRPPGRSSGFMRQASARPTPSCR